MHARTVTAGQAGAALSNAAMTSMRTPFHALPSCVQGKSLGHEERKWNKPRGYIVSSPEKVEFHMVGQVMAAAALSISLCGSSERLLARSPSAGDGRLPPPQPLVSGAASMAGAGGGALPANDGISGQW